MKHFGRALIPQNRDMTFVMEVNKSPFVISVYKQAEQSPAYIRYINHSKEIFTLKQYNNSQYTPLESLGF